MSDNLMPNVWERGLFRRRGWILALAYAGVLAARMLIPGPLQIWALWLVVAGVALRFAAAFYIGPHVRGASLGAEDLADRGLYSLSRNPLYLSNLLVGCGLVLFAGCFQPVQAVALSALLVFHHALLIRAEESFLRGRFGEAYEVYATRVPRWAGLGNLGARQDWRPVMPVAGVLRTQWQSAMVAAVAAALIAVAAF